MAKKKKTLAGPGETAISMANIISKNKSTFYLG